MQIMHYDWQIVWSIGKCVHIPAFITFTVKGKTLILCCTIIRACPVNRVHGGRYNIFFNEQYLIIRLKMYDIYTRANI